MFNLGSLLHIQTGLFAKGYGEGDVHYLQVRHFNEQGKRIEALYGDLLSNELSQKHLLQEGDVLFAAKGMKNYAVAVDKDWLPAVASTSFFVLRVTNKKLSPNYLMWYLNSPTIQGNLKNKAIGTAMPSISKQALESIEIPIPSLKTQEVIVKLSALRQKELEIKQNIELLRTEIIHHTILKSLHKSHE